MLNATEFVEMEVQDQRDNDLQIEFAIGDADKVIPPLVFNSYPERPPLAVTRDVATLAFDFSVCG